MSSVLAWFLFGMFVWGCVIIMQAFQNKVAPEMNSSLGFNGDEDDFFGDGTARRQIADRDHEITELKQRIEVLEAIVTDRRYHWESELRRG